MGNGVTLGTSAQFTSSVGTVSLARSVLEPTSVFLKVLLVTTFQHLKIRLDRSPRFILKTLLLIATGENKIRRWFRYGIDEDSKFASGKADIIGMVSSSEIVDRAMGGVAEYYATSYGV